MYPGFKRCIEWTQYIVGKERCVPGVVISMCIQGTRDILNGQYIVGKQRRVAGVVISVCIQDTRDVLNGHSI